MSVEVKRKDSLRLVIAERAIEELGKVYQRKEAFLRELLQNAVDAGASRVDIRFEDAVDGRYVVVEHDGEPIEGEYLNAFLTVGTDYKAKRGDRYIGMYGIGRLSWLLIGDKAVIETGNNRLIWEKDRIMELDHESLAERVEGVRWKIRLTRQLTVEEVANYLRSVYYGDVPVYVEGRQVKTSELGELFLKHGSTEVYRSKSSHDGAIIKGIFRVGTRYLFRGFTIKTDDPRVKINPSRDIIYDEEYDKWEQEISLAILKRIKETYTPEEALKTFGVSQLNDLASTAIPTSWRDTVEEREEKYRRRLAFLPFETGTGSYIWGDVLDPDKWLYSRQPLTDTSVRKLMGKGYGVVYVRSDMVAKYLEWLDYEDASDFIIKEEARTVDAADMEDKLKSVYNKVEEILENLSSGVVGTGKPSVETESGHVKAEVKVYADAVELGGLGASLAEKKNIVRGKIVGKLKNLPIIFVAMDDPDVRAFTEGWKIYINVNNRLMAELVARSKRIKNVGKLLLLWGPVVLHEALHLRGLDHTDYRWNDLFEEAIMKLNMEAVSLLKS